MASHRTFTIERQIAGCLEHVWACWTDADLKRRWFAAEGAGTEEYRLDLREGGTEYGRFVLPDGPAAGVHENRTTYLVVRDKALLATAYTMAWDGRIHSASLATIRFAEEAGGTRLTIEDTGAYFDPSDGPEGRRHGTGVLLDALEAKITNGDLS